MQRRDVRTSVPDSNTHHTANGKRNVPEGRTKTRENVQENKKIISLQTLRKYFLSANTNTLND